MNEKKTILDANEINGGMTLAEFDDFVEIYKKQNPKKHAEKLASGEFQKFREKLIGYVKPVPPKPEVQQEVVVEDIEQPKPKLGRPPKVSVENKE